MLAVVLDQGLQRDAGREAQHHLGGGAEEDHPFDHGGYPVVARRPVHLDPDPLRSDHRVRGPGRISLTPLRGQRPVAEPERAGRPGRDDLDLHQVGRAQEVSHVGVCGLLVDLAGGADLHDPARVHHGQPVRHGQRLFLVVGDVEKGDADLFLQRLQLDLERPAELGVQRAERLVQQQHGRLEHEGAGQRDPLLLAAGQLAWTPLGERRHMNQLEGLVHAAPQIRLIHPPVPQPERHVVGHGQEREQRVTLEHGVDVAPVRRNVGHVDPVEQDLARGRLLEAGDQAQGSGLAAARRAEEGEELTAGHGQVDVVDRDLGEPLGQPRQLDASSGHGAISLLTAFVRLLRRGLPIEP
jgi:hypothetical protein